MIGARQIQVRGPYFAAVTATVGLAILASALFIHPNRKQAATAADADARLEIQEGAWGRIDAMRMPLVNPDGPLPDEAERMAAPQWRFESVSDERLGAFLKSCDLRSRQARVLLERSNWLATSNGFVISPPLSIVWSLSTEAREQIYSVLARNKANYQQQFAFRFPAGNFEQCLAGAGLSTVAIGRLKHLAYTNGSSLCLADLEIAKRLLAPRDFACLTMVLYQFPSFRLRLCVREKPNVDALVKYWTAGGRNKTVKPLLASMAYMPGGATVDVACLLPPFARTRLYTYPESWNDPVTARADCFYTALNFFNEVPDTNYLDEAVAGRLLATEWAPISGDPAYGDIVLLLNDEGRPIHAAVYIAGAFVFTKNGINPTQPWTVMKTGEMVQSYVGPKGAGRIAMLRHRP